MARLEVITCSKCGKQKEVWFPSGGFPPKICSDCTELAEEAKLQEHLAELAKLPTDERLRLIEEWIYNHSKNHPERMVRY